MASRQKAWILPIRLDPAKKTANVRRPPGFITRDNSFNACFVSEKRCKEPQHKAASMEAFLRGDNENRHAG